MYLLMKGVVKGIWILSVFFIYFCLIFLFHTEYNYFLIVSSKNESQRDVYLKAVTSFGELSMTGTVLWKYQYVIV